ncbi:hypothetical protein C2E23DRAFT_299710 [Lenzites betulinus]|nr:hypothetical protein C2E23DRAFT_299710 [Lenzites betulinus]
MASTRTHTQKTEAKASVKNTLGKRKKREVVSEDVRRWAIEADLPKDYESFLKRYGKIKMPKGQKCPCPYCDLSFDRPADMRRHAKTVHFNCRQYLCSFTWLEGGVKKRCPVKFAQKSTLYTHIKSKHAGWGKLPCTDPACKRTFHDASSQSRHYNEQHLGKAYECPYLGCRAHDGQPKR